MSLFRKSFIESVLTFDLISWFGNLHIRGKVASWRWPARRCLSHTPHWEFTRRSSTNPVCNPTLPHLEVESLTSGCRFEVPRTRCNRIKILYPLCDNSLKCWNVLGGFYCGVLWALAWCVVLQIMSCVLAFVLPFLSPWLQNKFSSRHNKVVRTRLSPSKWTNQIFSPNWAI